MRKTTLLALVAFLTRAGTTWAESNLWTPVGLVEGSVDALAVDTQNRGTVYAATSSGLFKTTDAGARWRTAGAGLPAGEAVASLAIDPKNPTTLYAGIGAMLGIGAWVFKTTDGGGSWSPASLGLPTFPPIPSGPGSWRRVISLAIDAQNSATVYAGIDYPAFYGDAPFVFKTIDGGETWSRADSGLPPAVFPDLAVDPQNSTTIYAASNRVGIFKSTDGGAHWSSLNLGLPNYSCCSSVESLHASIVIDPRNPGTLYASLYGGGVFKTTDGGITWSAIDIGPATLSVGALAVDPLRPSILYAGTANMCFCLDDPDGSGIWRSSDGGVSWSTLNSGFPIYPSGLYHNIYSLAIDSSAVYAGLYGGVWALPLSPSDPDERRKR
jgi:photosystem II stability/assembly factor-like uncharacterized protein